MISIIKNKCVLCHAHLDFLDHGCIARFSENGNYCLACNTGCLKVVLGLITRIQALERIQDRLKENKKNPYRYLERRAEFSDFTFEFLTFLDPEPSIFFTRPKDATP